MNFCKMNSPLGELYIFEEDNKIVQISTSYTPAKECKEEMSELLSYTVGQLNEYFAGTRKAFSIPLDMRGTEFQKRVWNALLEIPYGETWSYKQLAEFINNPKAVRAVGGANHNNPIMIIVPCHRVIGSNGSLTGYAGGLDMKEHLLNLERAVIRS